MKILVTGGAGFIGSAVVRRALADGHSVCNLDALTYAGNLMNLRDVELHPNYRFVEGNIADERLVKQLFEDFAPNAVMHLAAESHVDKSISGPRSFIETNVVGTFVLLDQALKYWQSEGENLDFRFLHISTDEVFGELGPDGAFHEDTPYNPSSPYSASKAASDHLVRAWGRTYGLPVLLTNCSNNYGPFQFPEKLIPLTILNAINGRPIGVYGNGQNIRDWLYVDDHAEALLTVLDKGKIGRSYNIGGNCESTNIDLVMRLCEILDGSLPASRPYREKIQFVEDRAGHDYRYAINSSRITSELGWSPRTSFDIGLNETVKWCLSNRKLMEQALGLEAE